MPCYRPGAKNGRRPSVRDITHGRNQPGRRKFGMINLELVANEGHIKVRFDVPDKPGEKVRLDELATFSLHLDLIKHRITEIVHKAVAKHDGFDISFDT